MVTANTPCVLTLYHSTEYRLAGVSQSLFVALLGTFAALTFVQVTARRSCQ